MRVSSKTLHRRESRVNRFLQPNHRECRAFCVRCLYPKPISKIFFYRSISWRQFKYWLSPPGAEVFYAHVGLKSRSLDDIAEVRKCWAHLGKIDPSTLKLRPTVAWRTVDGDYAALWKTTGPVSEALNHLLNDALGVENTAWRWLACQPWPARILWDDGPTYAPSRVERWAEWKIIRRIEPGARPILRDALKGRCIPPGIRSDLECKVSRSLIEAGIHPDNALAILMKAQIKPRSLRRMKAEVDRAIFGGAA